MKRPFRTKKKMTLYVMHAEDMFRVHPQTTWKHRCHECGSMVGIYPSGQQIIAQHGAGGVSIICNRCMPPDLRAPLAPGAAEEPLESVANPLYRKPPE